MPYASAQSDQPFVVRCLDSIISLVSISEISSLLLVSTAEQAGLSLTWSQTPMTGFLVTRLFLKRLFAGCCSITYFPETTAVPLKGEKERKRERSTSMTGTERQNMDHTLITGEGFNVVVLFGVLYY